ncbi:Serine/threonine-protein phosphatase 2A activator 2 [Malassezia vespertilionis]|uniref:Serine/threonine-protein phosphatase 2A activator n=1 Tax=Malassezia vespertilionis TaxID=2020962 RepID=A0A2N1J7A1_9BASI|nr:Serine/threonine-protein phosphatase 2A activator 2 [Malassezia vespertilionis]PKI82436.1 Rrd2p [Malassezia vespertilionis]WFD07955.1 Serine/threonine-protein phosphatase 2A activator 2 [Malassezia vespertilionis]
MVETKLNNARDALTEKLRAVRNTDVPQIPLAHKSESPTGPGDNDPFQGAMDPLVVAHPDLNAPLPKKRIVTQSNLDHFAHSQAFAEILGMIRSCNEYVKGRKLTDNIQLSAPVERILDIVDKVRALVDETPRDTDSASTSRFGNPAFRTLYRKVVDATDTLLQTIPGLENGDDPAYQERLRKELAVYFYESWGNAKRIDYGSGMELNFLCWLLGLTKLGILQLARDAEAIVLRVFWKYIQVMRVVQQTYWLEPAGSHGVWGLDDYHFLPFLWGAGQLVGHPYLKPKSIHDVEVLDEFAPDYMYFACIHAINSVKTESLRWHSPMLDDISDVRSWAKVDQGMVKMYRVEVLCKLPIAQHMYFGTLLDYGAPDTGSEDVEEDEHGHLVHAGSVPHGHRVHGHGEGQGAGWGDCCGIPIPSVFAAAEQNKAQAGRVASTPIRRIPFD